MADQVTPKLLSTVYRKMIAEIFKNRIKELSLTHKTLAEKLGCSRANVTQQISNASIDNLRSVVAYCQALEIAPEDFFFSLSREIAHFKGKESASSKDRYTLTQEATTEIRQQVLGICKQKGLRAELTINLNIYYPDNSK